MVAPPLRLGLVLLGAPFLFFYQGEGILLARKGGKLRRKTASTQLPPSNGAEVYFLLQYSNQFCGGSISLCQQVEPDSLCHMQGGHYVKATDNGDGTMKVEPGTDSDCSCANADALTYDYTVDSMDHHGQFTQQACNSGGGIGVRLLKGTWCEKSTFQSCHPKDDKFTRLVKEGCGGSYSADVASARSCNYPGFNLKSTEILKHVAKTTKKDASGSKMEKDSENSHGVLKSAAAPVCVALSGLLIRVLGPILGMLVL